MTSNNSNKAAHVFITNNYETVRKYFFSDSQFLSSDAIKVMESDPNIFFGSPEKNSVITGLTHKYSDQEHSKSDHPLSITLDIIDPFFTFEEEMLKHLNLGYAVSPKHPEPDFDPKSSRQRYFPKEGEPGHGSGPLIREDRIRKRPSPHLAGIFGSRTPTHPYDMDKIKKYYLERLKSVLENSGTRTFYIAYGIGTDFNEWAGPIVSRLTGMRLDVNSEEVRKIKLRFLPSLGHAPVLSTAVSSPRPHLEDLFGDDIIKYEGVSHKISDYPGGKTSLHRKVFSKKPKNEEERKKFEITEDFIKEMSRIIEQGYPPETGAWGRHHPTHKTLPKSHLDFKDALAAGEQRREELMEEMWTSLPEYGTEGVKGEFDFHAIVEDCYSSYLQQVSESNVITLLPNINVTHKSLINDIMKDDRENFQKEIDDLHAKASSLGRSRGTARMKASSDKIKQFLENPWWKREAYVKKVLKNFNITLTNPTKAVAPDDSRIEEIAREVGVPVSAMSLGPGGMAGIPSFVPYSTGANVLNLETFGTTEYHTQATFKISKKDIDEYNSHRGATHVVPLYGLVIKSLLKGLNQRIEKGKKDNPQRFKIVTLMETNTRILNIWKKLGIIATVEPTLIFGELNLIKQFLYSEIDWLEATGKQHQLISDISQAEFLHPSDKNIYFNPKYKKLMMGALRRKPNNFFSTLEDLNKVNFGRDENMRRQLDTLTVGTNIPVFKAYTKNGNVLSTKLDVNETYMAFIRVNPKMNSLDIANNRLYSARDSILQVESILPEVIKVIEDWIDKPAFSKADSYSKEQIGDLRMRGISAGTGGGSRGAAMVYAARSYENAVGQDRHLDYLQTKLDALLTDFPNKSELLAAILAVYGIWAGVDEGKDDTDDKSGKTPDPSKPKNPTIKINSNKDAAAQLMNLYEHLYNFAHSVSIKTYPNFSLSMDSDILAKQCILLAQTPHIKGVATNPDAPFDKLLTGKYRIKGFTHTLTAGEISSHFHLFKDTRNLTQDDLSSEEIAMRNIKELKRLKTRANSWETEARGGGGKSGNAKYPLAPWINKFIHSQGIPPTDFWKHPQ